MAKKRVSLLDRIVRRRAYSYWSKAARASNTTPLSVLRNQRGEARRLRYKLEELTHTADYRLALPRIGNTAFARPAGSDWSWRPQVWSGAIAQKGYAAIETNTMLGSEVKLFHDCQISEITLRQVRNQREEDLAPFGLRMDVFRFDGSFLSLVLDLPQSGCDGLSRDHLIRMDAIIELERPIEIFARLNVRHGPNTEQVVREIPVSNGVLSTEFDLAYTGMNEKRVEAMWIDLIFEGPEMNQVTIRDVTLCRVPRAAF